IAPLAAYNSETRGGWVPRDLARRLSTGREESFANVLSGGLQFAVAATFGLAAVLSPARSRSRCAWLAGMALFLMMGLEELVRLHAVIWSTLRAQLGG